MNVEEYINSGVLHDYCVGLLSEAERADVERYCARYPEVRAELLQLQAGIEKFAEKTARTPSAHLQQNIWNTLDNINREKTGDLSTLPVINKYSDHNNWKRLVLPFMPEEMNQDRIMTPIREAGGITQILVLSKTSVEDEVHEHEHESFLVLEGECECQIGDDIHHLGPGGFIEIPLYTIHNVKVLSPYVVAVLQHVAI